MNVARDARSTILLSSLIVLAGACDSVDGEQRARAARIPSDEGARGAENAPDPRTVLARAEVDLDGTPGKPIDGVVKLEDVGGAVRVFAHLRGAEPGTHAAHVHSGNCGDVKHLSSESVGEHVAPRGHVHALPSDTSPEHLGDLGNIQVDEGRQGQLQVTVQGANLRPGAAMSLLGKIFVVHRSEDLGRSRQPGGGAGEPIACGVIELG